MIKISNIITDFSQPSQRGPTPSSRPPSASSTPSPSRALLPLLLGHTWTALLLKLSSTHVFATYRVRPWEQLVAPVFPLASSEALLGKERKEEDLQQEAPQEGHRTWASTPNWVPQYGLSQDERTCRIQNTFWCSLALLHRCRTQSLTTEHKVQCPSLAIFSNH